MTPPPTPPPIRLGQERFTEESKGELTWDAAVGVAKVGAKTAKEQEQDRRVGSETGSEKESVEIATGCNRMDHDVTKEPRDN